MPTPLNIARCGVLSAGFPVPLSLRCIVLNFYLLSMSYRNYRELSDEEIQKIGELYPVTPNRELARRFNVSVDAIQDYLAYPNGWKKNRKAVLIGSRKGRSLTEKEIGWIIRHYQNTKNEDILRKFGIGESTLHRVARKYGLKKTRQFMKKSQQAAANIGMAVCKEFGIYEQNAEYARQQWEERKASGEPLSRWKCFQPGESNKTRLSPKRYKECIEKSKVSRNETIRKERMRIRWGFEQKTKLKLVGGGSIRSSHRHLFRKAGYIVDRASNEVYFDEETVRHPIMEANAHKWGLKVLPY